MLADAEERGGAAAARGSLGASSADEQGRAGEAAASGSDEEGSGGSSSDGGEDSDEEYELAGEGLEEEGSPDESSGSDADGSESDGSDDIFLRANAAVSRLARAGGRAGTRQPPLLTWAQGRAAGRAVAHVARADRLPCRPPSPCSCSSFRCCATGCRPPCSMSWQLS